MCSCKSKLILITFQIHNRWQRCHKILSTKNTIAQQLQLCLFIIINRDENYPPKKVKTSQSEVFYS